jgi:F-box-like
MALVSQTRTARLRFEGSQVRAQMHNLLREAEVQHCAEVHDAPVSPVCMLPPELLSTIFIFCLPEDWRSSSCRPLHAPMLLTQICGQWRSVAVSTPLLWSCISFEYWPVKMATKTPLLETWLLRSGGSTLSIRLHEVRVHITSLILPYSNRFQHLHITLPTSMLDQISVIQDRLDLLETLTIDTVDDATWRDDSLNVVSNSRSQCHAFYSAPRLRDVHIGYGTSPRMLSLPWAQLTNCLADSCNIDECLHILSQSSQLIKCKLECSFKRRVISYAGGMLQLPNLLYLHLVTWINPGILFDSIALPAACSIRIDYMDIFSWPQSSFVSLLSRSLWSLSTLIFDTIPLTDTDLIRCLQETPFLKQLEVLQCALCISHELVDRLTFRAKSGDGGGPCLLSTLEELRFTGLFSVGLEGLVDMVQSRWHGSIADPEVNGLKLVQFLPYVQDEELDAEAIRRLTEFRENGLDISVAFDNERVV